MDNTWNMEELKILNMHQPNIQQPTDNQEVSRVTVCVYVMCTHAVFRLIEIPPVL